ncbi:carboxymuconolactone decarboxylase family protein [Pseudarthrobacter sp. LMD1-1-1.1]|uniref:carboxymuconolactone decarboxylase family protein n=1 Tax=Pseudarthrobacter sp. LMD1-1-1.1 TaxID=3135242 RepID=UPI0034268800
MPRLSYALPSDATAERIRNRRGGILTPLDKLLSHNDALAAGWNSLLGAVRQQFSIRDDVRELIILRVAVLNNAEYEWAAHVDLGIRFGLDESVLEQLREESPSGTGNAEFDAVIAYTDEMTRNISVTEATFERLRTWYSESEIVELTATVASYNMVSRFLVALGVEASDREPVLSPNA